MRSYVDVILQDFYDCTGLAIWYFNRMGRLFSHIKGDQVMPMGYEKALKGAFSAIDQLQKQSSDSHITYQDYPMGMTSLPVHHTACYLCPGCHDVGLMVFGPYSSNRTLTALPYKPIDAALPMVTLLRSLAAARLPDQCLVTTTSDNYHIRKMMDYLRENCHKDISMEELCHYLGISKPYLCRLFKQETGTTIFQYVHCLRLERSRLLMADPALSLTDISLAVGYKNQSHFVRHFKALTGHLPSIYRRINYPKQKNLDA